MKQVTFNYELRFKFLPDIYLYEYKKILRRHMKSENF